MDNDIGIDDSFFSCSSSAHSFISANSDDTNSPSLNEQLSSIFHPRDLNIAHINAQSVPSHYFELLVSFNNISLDILMISETFLKPSLQSTQYSIPGYVLVRNDRTGKGGGGVAMAKRRSKRRPTNENFQRYKLLRNRCNHLCRDAKRRHFYDSLSGGGCPNAWRFLKSIGIGKSGSGRIEEDLWNLNKHFLQLPISMDSAIRQSTLAELAGISLPQCAPFVLDTVTEDDVKKSFRSISSTAVGCDK
ncbi:hypothetical protein ACJJTC_014840, partial [Scirpophaga incertulas]